MEKNREKLNNQGFTLLEILIAMSILAIIVVPLLHTFVTAGATNAKAKKILKATTQAQNIMEELKSTSASEIAEKVYLGTSSGFPCYGFTAGGENAGSYTSFEAAEGTDGTYTQTTGTVTVSQDGKATYQGSQQADGSFCYVLPNVTFEGSAYDVVLKMIPEHNASNVDINSMNDAGSVLFTDAVSVHSVPAEYFWSKNQEHFGMTGQGVSRTANEFQRNMTRTTTVTLSSESTGNCSVSLTSVFAVGSSFNNDLEAADRTYSDTPETRSAKAESVYLFYYPLYGINRDTFIIQNPDNLDINVYLICMQGAEYTEENELNYRAHVVITENNNQSEYLTSGTAKARTKLHMTLLSNVSTNQFSIEDNNNKVVTRAESLGNRETTVYQYRTEVKVYTHSDEAFETVGGSGMVFHADASKLLTDFDGSMREHTK